MYTIKPNSKVIRRNSLDYVITLSNGFPYNVIEGDPLLNDVNQYIIDHPDLIEDEVKKPIPEPTLEEVKEDKKYEISIERYKNEISGIIINDIHIATDRDSQSLITGAALAAIDDENYICNWKTANGIGVKLDASTIKLIAKAVRNHVQECFDKELELINQINNATTIEEVQSIKW